MEEAPQAGGRVKIEQPETEESLGFFHSVLLILSLILISFTISLLVMEWFGTSLPPFLRIPVG